MFILIASMMHLMLVSLRGSSDGSGFIGSRVCHLVARDATVAWDPLNAHCGFALVDKRSDVGSALVIPFERTA